MCLNKDFGDAIRYDAPAEFFDNAGKWDFDFIKKYLEESTVLATAKVYSGMQVAAEQTTGVTEMIITLYEDEENPENTVKLAVNLQKLGKEFFDFLFDKFFRMLLFVDSVVESPKDPPCMLA